MESCLIRAVRRVIQATLPEAAFVEGVLSALEKNSSGD